MASLVASKMALEKAEDDQNGTLDVISNTTGLNKAQYD